MDLYDTHCHLDFDTLSVDLDAVLARAAAAGVRTLVIPGVDPTSWDRAASLGSSCAVTLRCAVGLHPRAIENATIADVESFARRAANVVAIGEFGWDSRVTASAEAQDRAADEHIELARALDLPVMLHIVGRYGHALQRLTRHGPFARGGVIHAFGGSSELVPSFASLGLSFGFGAALCHGKATKIVAAARAVPQNHLLLETDAPDQSVTRRGHGEPAELLEIATRLAEIRDRELDAIAELTTANARALFER